VASDGFHGDEQQWHGDGDDPGPVSELGDQGDDLIGFGLAQLVTPALWPIA
jgi:hypothetical protein